MPTDVAQFAHSSSTTTANGVFVCSCLPTGRSFTISTSTDSNYVSFDTSLTPTELETKYTTRFDDIAYYNAVDGGTP
jgi:hypothetical protein